MEGIVIGIVSDYNVVCVIVMDIFESLSEIIFDFDGLGSLNEFLKSIFVWDCYFVDKLGVRYR